MTEDEREQIWADIEAIAVESIGRIAKLLDTLDESDKLAIYINLEQIATDGIKQVNKTRELH